MMTRKNRSGVNRRAVLNNAQKTQNALKRNQEGISTARRPLLKGISATLASLGFGGQVAGQSTGTSEIHEKATRAAANYQSPTAVVEAFDKHAKALVEELANHGYLKSANGSNLNIGQVRVFQSPAEVDPTAGTYLTAFKKGEQFTAHISVIRKTPTRVIRINVQPQAGESFATVKTRDGELVSVVDPNKEDVSTQKFCGSDGYTCPPDPCCFNCGTLMVKHERICCKYADGSVDCHTEPINQCCEPAVCC